MTIEPTQIIHKDWIDFMSKRMMGMISIPESAFNLKGFCTINLENYTRRKCYKITIIGYANGETILKEIRNFENLEVRLQLIDEITNLIFDTSWTVVLQNELYLIKKEFKVNPNEERDIRKAIVQKVEVPQLEKFYKELNNILQLEKHEELLPPFTCFTTHIRGTDPKKYTKGIGIHSEASFKALNPTRLESLERKNLIKNSY